MRALLIDDRPMVLSELHACSAALGDDFELVCAGSVRAACDMLSSPTCIDIVLLEVRGDSIDSLHMISELRSACPSLPILVVSHIDATPPTPTPSPLVHLLALRLSQGSPPVALTGAAPATAMPAADDVDGSGAVDGLDWRYRTTAHASLGPLGLTPRQTQVLSFLLAGHSNKLIAREIGISLDTVKDHVTGLMRSLNVTSRTQAVLEVTRRMQMQRAAGKAQGEAGTLSRAVVASGP